MSAHVGSSVVESVGDYVGASVGDGSGASLNDGFGIAVSKTPPLPSGLKSMIQIIVVLLNLGRGKLSILAVALPSSFVPSFISILYDTEAEARRGLAGLPK